MPPTTQATGVPPRYGEPLSGAGGNGRPTAAAPADEAVIRESVTAPERFGLLFDRHAVAVHRYLGRRIGEPADDLLAETFLVAFRRRADFRPIHIEVRPWLFGIATNLLHRHARQEQRRYRALARAGAVADAPPVFTDAAVERVDAGSVRRDLAGALARLKHGDRDVLLLHAWADLSYAEIATVLDIPVGTVRSRLNRARRLTREALGSVPGLTAEEES